MRFSLANKISLTIIVVGIFGVMLVYYISSSYKDFAYQHHTTAMQQLAYLEIDDLTEKLKENSLDLALAIEHEGEFKYAFKKNDLEKLSQQLDNQFYQYFVTAGVIKLLKLYILDTDFTLLSTSREGVETDADSELICPQLSQAASNRHGPEQLQTMSRICIFRDQPVFAVIVPFGGLNPKGYIQVITDLAHNLKQIESSLAMPIQINLLSDDIAYQSENWQQTANNRHYLPVHLPVTDLDEKEVMTITLRSDMSDFDNEILQHRNWVMALALVTTALTVLIVLLILQRSTIPPLARIHDALEKIHSPQHGSGKNSRILFEQLLESIIQLRRKSKTSFAIMLLDLNHFKKINSEYGQTIGDLLLVEVEQRLGSILRNSDMISWVGTDTPGHKLRPADSKTQYRATIARLGGDEFGILLPTAQSEEQAIAVAQRVIETLNEAFIVYDQHIEIDCKIGISIFPDHGDDEKVLIRNADKAMHQAKSLHETFCIYDESWQNS